MSLAEAKLHLRVDIDDDDDLISALIVAAREYAETLTGRCFVAQSWRYVIDSFPGLVPAGVPWGKVYSRPGNAIYLQRSPVQAVTSITYLDMSSTEQTVPPTLYTADMTSEPARITPCFGQIWPIPLPEIGAVEVDFVAGYAAPITVDQGAGTIAVMTPWTQYDVGDPVRLSNTGGGLAAPLSLGVDYYIQSVVSPGVYTLAATAGGAPISFTSGDSGQSFVGVVPEGIKAWMKIRIGSMYQHREEMAMTERSAKLVPLPFVDRLLDRYIVSD